MTNKKKNEKNGENHILDNKERELFREQKEKEIVQRVKQEKREIKDREEIERRLEKAENELKKIAEKELEVTGVDRVAQEINRLKRELDEITPKNNRNIYYGFTAIVVFLGILAVPPALTPGLSIMGQRALAIFALVFVLWITEAIPLPATAFIPGILLFLLNIRPTPSEAFKTYAHPAIFFIIGSFLIAHALVQSGIAKRFAYLLLSKCRNNPNFLLFLFISVGAIFSMFISDHLMAAMLIPVAITIISAAKIEGPFQKALILGTTFGVGVGSVATPSGGARNVIALGLLEELAGQQIGYVDWMIAALPVALLLIPVVFVTLRFLFPPGRIDIQTAVTELGKTVRPMAQTQWRVLAIFAFTIILFITTSNLIGLGTAAIIGAVLMFLSGSLKWEEAEKQIAWGIIFIYGAAITIGIALMDTGAAAWLAGNLTVAIPGGPLVIYFGVMFIVIALTNVMSDGATASIIAPISITMALVAGLNAPLMAMATAIPAAFSYITIFGTPVNTIAYSSGFVKAKDFAKAGSVIVAAAMAIMYFMLVYYWPSIGLKMVVG